MYCVLLFLGSGDWLSLLIIVFTLTSIVGLAVFFISKYILSRLLKSETKNASIKYAILSSLLITSILLVSVFSSLRSCLTGPPVRLIFWHLKRAFLPGCGRQNPHLALLNSGFTSRILTKNRYFILPKFNSNSF